MPLYDYLYVDLPKVISLYSQITGGVVESREATQEHARSADNKRNYDFKVFRHDAGGTENDKGGIKEFIKPHHSLLAELESELAAKGYLLDLTKQVPSPSLRDPELRALLSTSLCIKVTGRAVIEDYERLKGTASAFPDVAKLINKSIESAFKDSPDYKELQEQLEVLGGQVKAEKDRNTKATKEAQLKRARASLATMATSAGSVGAVDQWILDGLKTWIDTFLPGIINLRLYPSLDHPDEQFFGHLKREHFEDRDQSSFHFTYGSVPTEPISLIGIVTAIPTELEDDFKPLAEFAREGLANTESVESAFRGVFRGFDGMEQMIRTCRFPRVLVQPLVVYRSVEPNPALQGMLRLSAARP
jgi:hypothetical protein